MIFLLGSIGGDPGHYLPHATADNAFSSDRSVTIIKARSAGLSMTQHTTTGNIIVSNMRVIIEQAVCLSTTPGGLHFCSSAFNLAHDAAKRDTSRRRFHSSILVPHDLFLPKKFKEPTKVWP